MVQIFSNFTTTLVIVGVILAIGIIFEEKFLALEEKFDEWFARYKANLKSKKETKNNVHSRTN
jgi:hypothetical protein